MSGKTYTTPDAFRAALETRAKKKAREVGAALDLVRRKFAFQAFLMRVPASGAPVILKGGFLLHLRYDVGVRPTRDLDAAIKEDGLEKRSPREIENTMRELLETVASVDLGDFFSFEIGESMADLGLGREFVGYRFNVKAKIGSRLFDTFHIDTTAGDALIDPFDKIVVGDAFDFASLPEAKVFAISEAQHFAEKLHAYLRDRGGKKNSRVKDLFDMVLFIKQGVDEREVATAIEVVFRQCGNTPIPKEFSEPPIEWRSPFDEMARDNGLEITMEGAYRLASAYYEKILLLLSR